MSRMKIALFLVVLGACLSLPGSDITAQKPDWQRHCDWCIANVTGADEVNCPDQYLGSYPACLTNGGRACLMQKAIESARANDYNNSFRLALICQCHSRLAQNQIQVAGPQAVGRYLRTK